MKTQSNNITFAEMVKVVYDCSLEDVQYHLYVVDKIHRGIERAEKEGTLSQDEVERKLEKWTSKYGKNLIF